MATKKQQQIDGGGVAHAKVALPGTGDAVLDISADPKQFKSGNRGWWGQQKFTLSDGSTVNIQLTIVRKGA